MNENYRGKKHSKNGLPLGTIRCLRCKMLVAINSYDEHSRFCNGSRLEELPPVVRGFSKIIRSQATRDHLSEIMKERWRKVREEKSKLQAELELKKAMAAELKVSGVDEEEDSVVIAYPEEAPTEEEDV
jgi:hypothetical protein